MSHNPHATLAAVPNVHDTLARLRASGYRDGPPPQVSERDARIDRAVCRRMPCEHCGRRGLRPHALHKGDVYRVIGACPSCGGATEM